MPFDAQLESAEWEAEVHIPMSKYDLLKRIQIVLARTVDTEQEEIGAETWEEYSSNFEEEEPLQVVHEEESVVDWTE